MKKILSGLLASAIIATSVVSFAGPAAAGPRQDRYMEQYYSNNNRDSDYWQWKKNRSRWDDREYRRWYRSHRRNNNDAAVAGIFGLAAGAILGSALSANANANANANAYVYTENDRYCASRFRSYDPVSKTYMGYDGHRHSCP